MASEPLVVQAIYSYKRTNNDELNFKKGDIITVTQKDEGWWEGTLNGQTGWFPSNYVKESKDAPKPVINQQNQYKGVVLKDLIDSEKAHVTELEGLVTNFLQPLEKSSILTPDEYKQLTGNITEILETHQQLLSLIEAESNKPGNEQRVGKLFLTWAPRIKNVHQAYCSLHPKAVCILDKYRDELTKYMESKGAASPGVLVLTTMLSKPFRRLDKYSGMLQELERHVEECHPDRGDTQRSVSVYKDIAATCSATRRQKELELQVLTGPVRGWEGPSLNSLGDIIYMGSVAIGPQHHDRYFVLFPTTLVILSVSHRLSAFIYEGKLFLSGLTAARLEDSDQYKNAFEISAPMIDKRIAVCQSKEEADHWVDLLRKQTCKSSTSSNGSQKVTPSQAQFVPQPPPHSCSLNQRGYCNRTSVLSYQPPLGYTPVTPPENYPSTSPYAALTRYYYKLIKSKVITSRLLKQLLYSEYLNKFNLSLVKIRHYKTETSIFIKDIHCRDSIINCDSDSDSSDTMSSSDSDNADFKFKRQDDMKVTSGEGSSTSSNPFGYVWYYNPKTGSERQETLYECFEESQPEANSKPKLDLLNSPSVSKPIKQISEESEASANIPEPKAYMACEDLHTLEDNLELKSDGQGYIPTVRQSCPTKLVGNKFNQSSLTTIYIPPWSNSENNISHSKNPSHNTETHSTILEIPAITMPLPDRVLGELLYNFDGEFSKSQSIDSSETVIKPPTLFSKDVEVVAEKISLTMENVKFRKHSIDSDKPKRRSSIHNPQDKRLSRYMDSDKPTTSRQSICRCCMEYCHSPRSSDSGMADSCTMNSPDLGNPNEVAQERCSLDMSHLFHQFNDSRNVISLSEIEARNFELECPCTSPFGSTPRTSGQECTPGYVLTGSRDSLRSSAHSRMSQSKRHSKMFDSEAGVQKSRSTGCLLEESGKEGDDEIERSAQGAVDDGPMVYKSELYAHWWLKAKIPSEVVRGIYFDTRSPTTDVSTNSRKRDKPAQ